MRFEQHSNNKNNSKKTKSRQRMIEVSHTQTIYLNNAQMIQARWIKRATFSLINTSPVDTIIESYERKEKKISFVSVWNRFFFFLFTSNAHLNRHFIEGLFFFGELLPKYGNLCQRRHWTVNQLCQQLLAHLIQFIFVKKMLLD